ncbi:MAG: bifunctional DNA-formamidopyrimidine glycosylase/DNA-(apurinic or apyrimidinic site) lyase [Chloroflexota bacterium]
MPELPEVEHVARSLQEQIVGSSIVAVTHLDWERMVETPSVDQFCELLQGRKIQSAGRRAKWLLVTLDAGWTLAFHLRMSGYITIQDTTATPDKYVHLVIQFTDGRQFFFHDTRKFGRTRLLDPVGLRELDQAHGIEPLSEEFSSDELRSLLRNRQTRVKPLLLDQTVIAGIGNIYADEALWHAQIHPLRISSDLSDDEVDCLHKSIRKALQTGLNNGGSTLRNYRNSYGEQGTNQEHFHVYARITHPCPRCGHSIERITVGQRGTHICSQCQSLKPQNERSVAM